MSALLDWFDRYTGPKALNRAAGRWKCILGGLCPVTTAYGETIDEAIERCRGLAKQRRSIFAEIERQDRETAAATTPTLRLEDWEQPTPPTPETRP